MEKAILEIAGRITGIAGIVVEREDGTVLVSSNADHLFPSASIIKLFILWAVYKKIQMGKLTEETMVNISDTPVVHGCGILQQLHTSGLKLTVRDAATLMIVLSDNIATNLLISLVGMDFINEEMRANGFVDSKLERYLMDSEAKNRGLDNYTTPKEQVKILRNIASSENISQSLRDSMLAMLKGQILNDYAPQYMPLDFSFAHKTGNLAATLHDVGIIEAPNGARYYTAIMLDQLEDIVEGKRVHNLLGEKLFELLR